MLSLRMLASLLEILSAGSKTIRLVTRNPTVYPPKGTEKAISAMVPYVSSSIQFVVHLE